MRELVESSGRFHGIAFTKTNFLDLWKKKKAKAGVQECVLKAIPDAELERFAEKKWDQRIMKLYKNSSQMLWTAKTPIGWEGKSRIIRFYRSVISQDLSLRPDENPNPWVHKWR
jgi:hypothetical protein